MGNSGSEKVQPLYQRPALSDNAIQRLIVKLNRALNGVNQKCSVKSIETEYCCYVQCHGALSGEQEIRLEWILKPTFETTLSRGVSHLRSQATDGGAGTLLVEIGPRLNFSTAYSTNAVSVARAVGLGEVVSRIERSTIYLIRLETPEEKLSPVLETLIVDSLHDRMTEQRYRESITTFKLAVNDRPWTEIDMLSGGVAALREASDELGLGFDDWDLEYYTNLFCNVLKRNPTTVECFDLAQSNSEHSRHWFFKGKMIPITDKNPSRKPFDESLLDMVIATQKHTNDNNIIKFNDNSSAIRGFDRMTILAPHNSSEPSLVTLLRNRTRHIIFTAETHNFPTGVAPFPGATTGTGGRIRDVQAAGRGAHVIAGTAGYSFGNLLIPGHDLPWESTDEIYPGNMAHPLEVCIEASNGASDYGNKFGEPVIAGFCRSFGMRIPTVGDKKGERLEWIKPIMFSGGIGSIDHAYVKKQDPERGMCVVKVGGPIYRIGVGGGAASSIEVQGDEANEDLDFGAVQRGDPEMEQKLNRVIRACIEYGSYNPIESIHDQGAGGNGNVIKEIIEPKGAVIYTKNFSLGDPTINTMELWGAEFQESNAILVRPEHRDLVEKIATREKCPVDFVGEVSGDGKIRLVEGSSQEGEPKSGARLPVDLDLEHVLGSMPRKEFHLEQVSVVHHPLQLPANLSCLDALERVLRLPSVCSKRFLTTKVDRSVTGLVAQQQCVGPLHIPLSDYSTIALGYFGYEGSATAIGEQPIKGILSPAAGARCTVAESVTNLMFCRISEMEDIKCSGNWMWPAKLKGEGIKLYEACKAMCQIMQDLGIGVDGGKDSLSMAAKVKQPAGRGQYEVVKSPGTLVVSTYAPVPDVRVKVTPVMATSGTVLLWIPIGGLDAFRLGGSALAQVYNQVGSIPPDVEKPQNLRRTFKIVQDLISSGVCTAGHDISDGGLVTCLLEMAFATNCGLDISLPTTGGQSVSSNQMLFAEEVGVVIEVKSAALSRVESEFLKSSIQVYHIGRPVARDLIKIGIGSEVVLEEKMTVLRDIWESTSFALDKLQANPECVEQEEEDLKFRNGPSWKLTFNPDRDIALRNIDPRVSIINSAPHVAVVREEGINGDREMIASLYMAGFEVADVIITDILGRRGLKLDCFRGLVFPGGFSYADVLGSARGWAATMKFNSDLEEQLARFKARSDTFSLGVCNGCQLQALLGWVSPADDEGHQGVLLSRNDSERFESRFSSVKIEEGTNSVLLRGMGGSSLGVWVAHGEGKFVFKNDQLLKKAKENNWIALRYVDDDGNPTQRYPANPNGSAMAIAGLSSPCGRHLALMPHPERCTNMWQWPYVPPQWSTIRTSPWCKMFTNAYDFCNDN